MDEVNYTLLKELSEAPGVSGAEEEVRHCLVRALRGQVDDLRADALGNLFAHKRGSGDSGLKVMVAAHMDEVGLMVVDVDKGGFLAFRAVGGIDSRLLPGKAVVIGEGKVPGVIGSKPPHLLSEDERNRVVEIEQLTIDIGAGSKEEAERLVKIGDRATFATSFGLMGEPTTGGLVKGKALDDRAGCAVLAELLRERYPFDLHAVFTVQEEIGSRGAQVAAYALEPDAAFVLEGTICDELPKRKDLSPTSRLGHGPVLTVMDRSLFVDQRLLRHLIETAEAEGIPYQIKQPAMGATDGGAIHRSQEGVPTAVIAVPCRYIHAPTSLLDLADFANAVRLMKAALQRFNESILNPNQEIQP
jgi:putative aminopeptidase FrvX